MNGKNCCVTGHRDIPKEQIDYVKEELKKEIDNAIKDGFIRFISGFAQGVDLLFAQAVLEAKNPHLQLIAAIPTRQRLNSLQKESETAALLDSCSEVAVIMEEYLPSVYSERNRFMVERADRVIAVYDGREAGGTAETVRLARELGKELRVIPVESNQ